MKERIQVYESLRNEIVTMEELQRTVWIYMYVLFCTLFVLGLQWSAYLFLVSYIVLIPFQCVINGYQWSISKMSTYIRIFFENEYRGMHWESLHVYEGYIDYYKYKKRSIIGIIRVSGATHLGLLATVFFCFYTLINSYFCDRFCLKLADILLIILSIVLFMLLAMINKDFYKYYNKELEDVIGKYKDYVNSLE